MGTYIKYIVDAKLYQLLVKKLLVLADEQTNKFRLESVTKSDDKLSLKTKRSPMYYYYYYDYY